MDIQRALMTFDCDPECIPPSPLRIRLQPKMDGAQVVLPLESVNAIVSALTNTPTS